MLATGSSKRTDEFESERKIERGKIVKERERKSSERERERKRKKREGNSWRKMSTCVTTGCECCRWWFLISGSNLDSKLDTDNCSCFPFPIVPNCFISFSSTRNWISSTDAEVEVLFETRMWKEMAGEVQWMKFEEVAQMHLVLYQREGEIETGLNSLSLSFSLSLLPCLVFISPSTKSFSLLGSLTHFSCIRGGKRSGPLAFSMWLTIHSLTTFSIYSLTTFSSSSPRDHVNVWYSFLYSVFSQQNLVVSPSWRGIGSSHQLWWSTSSLSLLDFLSF